jgi:hypothetical protein
MTAHDERRLPSSLRAIAWLSIFTGAAALVHFVVGIFEGRFFAIDLALLELPAGIGMLLLVRESRLVHMALMWLGLGAGCLFVAAWIMGAESTVPSDPASGGPSAWLIALGIAAALATFVWEHRVLTSPRVRELFASGRARRSRAT